MSLSFCRIMARTVMDLSPQLLQQRGIALLMLDFDNTIVPYTTDEPTRGNAGLADGNGGLWDPALYRLQQQKPRVVTFAKRYGLDVMTHAHKPSAKVLRACMARYGVAPEHAAWRGTRSIRMSWAQTGPGPCRSWCRRSIIIRYGSSCAMWRSSRLFLPRKEGKHYAREFKEISGKTDRPAGAVADQPHEPLLRHRCGYRRIHGRRLPGRRQLFSPTPVISKPPTAHCRTAIFARRIIPTVRWTTCRPSWRKRKSPSSASKSSI